ncbi:MAG TPA: glycosyltransferase family 1 protein [Nitrospinaceae bacterium]|nr:glycosyltransferase family 1 protein [Nitrospinaceae bacterium]
MKKLRVLFLTRKWAPAIGGMEVYSMELSEELSHSVDLTVRTLSGNKDGSPPGMARLICFLFSSLFFLWRTRRNFDVVHFGDFVLFSLAWWHAQFAPSITRIITVHGLDLIFGNRSGWKSVLYSQFVSWAVQRQALVDCFLANSRYTSSLCSELKLQKVAVIPLGIRSKINLPVFSAKCSKRERYILFLGRLVRRKGASWFAKNVLPTLPKDVKFYVAGKIWNGTEVEMLKNNPRVNLMDYVSGDRLPSLISESEMIVMPNITSPDKTDAEGFGLVALEGPAHGVPCVASSIEGLQDAVRPSETGFLVSAEDTDAWITQVNQILEWNKEERESFGRKAKEYLCTYFSWSRVAHDTLMAYQKSLDQKGDA